MSSSDIVCENCDNRNQKICAALGVNEETLIKGTQWCGVYKKGQTIYFEGAIPQGLYCINTGKVKLAHMGGAGKEQIVRLANAGDVMGYCGLLSGDAYAASAVALEDSSICFIPKEVVLKLIETNPPTTLGLMQLLAKDVMESAQRLTNATQKNIRERIAEGLLIMKNIYGTEADNATIDVQLSRAEIAEFVGTTIESIIRTLSDFTKEHVIELIGKKIKVLNADRLVTIANIHD